MTSQTTTETGIVGLFYCVSIQGSSWNLDLARLRKRGGAVVATECGVILIKATVMTELMGICACILCRE